MSILIYSDGRCASVTVGKYLSSNTVLHRQLVRAFRVVYRLLSSISRDTAPVIYSPLTAVIFFVIQCQWLLSYLPIVADSAQAAAHCSPQRALLYAHFEND